MLSPTAAASVALASLSYDTERSPLGLRPQQLTTSQSQVLPKTNPGRLLPALNTPSLDDINTLESSIASIQKQLNTLKSILPKDPAQQETLSQTINAAQSRLDTLNAKLAKAKADYSTYLKAQATLTSALSKYDIAILKENNLLLDLTQATSNYDSALAALNAQIALTQVAKTNLEAAESAFSNTQNVYNIATEKVQAQELITNNAKLTLEASQLIYQTSQQVLNSALISKNQAQANLNTVQSNQDIARAKYDQTVATYNQLLDIYTSVYADYLVAQTTYQIAQTALSQAESTLYQAQYNYDNLLIPDPNWTPLTYEQEHIRTVETITLVPRTTTTLTGGLTADVFNRQGYNNAPPLPTATELPIYSTIVSDINFNWGGGNVLGSNRSEDVIVRFTGNISFPTSGYYQFYSPADDGTILIIDGVQVTNDWRDKGGGGSTSAPIYLEGGSTHSITLYYYENGGGANVWLYYYTPQTGYQLVPAANLGTVATTETIYIYETTYTYETYYTTEVIPGQTHPLINDPALLLPLQEAQQNQQAALATFNQADQNWQVAQQNQQTAAQNSTTGYYNVIDDAQVLNELYPIWQEAQQAADSSTQLFIKADQETTVARGALDTAEQAYSDASGELLTNKSKVTEAQEVLNTSSNSFNSAKTTKEQAEQTLLTTQQTEQTTSTTKTSTEQQYQTAKQETTTSTQEKTLAEETLETATSTLSTSYQALSSEQQPDLTSIQNIIDTEPPLPEPEPEEQGSAEIPEVIENLMEVNLEAVDPTELTEAQAEQLVEAALVVFETATEGSPEYEQALDALYLAAEQDDIELSPELAAIPGLAGAVEALNFLGNAGADMSPKVREESEKVVVATVIAAGAAIQAAAGAATSAAASAGGSSGGGSRRTGK